MMAQYRMFLIKLRRLYNNWGAAKYYVLLSGIALILMIGTGILDVYTGNENMILKFVKAFLSCILGLLYFMIGYVYTSVRNVNKDVTHETLREKFSFKQRINICMLSFAVIIVLSLLLLKPGTYLYPTFFGLIITSIFVMLAFVRPTRVEMMYEEYGIPDARDLNFEREMELKEEYEKQKKEEKKKKKLRKKGKKVNDEENISK